MKNAFLFQTKTNWKKTPVLQFLLIAGFLFLCAQDNMLQAQARLSIQGILKKASGEAVSDGTYHLVFKLYTVETGGTDIWSEDQPAVEVVSGIYSAVLGNITPLTVSFNQLYYLGVTVGSTEMTPRTQLTSAPYALSLIGTTNQFPSSGIVKADSIRVAGGVLARGGTPGANGASKNGFAFTGNNGDKDSGLFSTGAGKVSLYVNNGEELLATPDSVVINGEVRAEDLRLDNDGKVNYNGLDDWRLVDVDNFTGTDPQGWQVYNKLPTLEWIGWNNPTAAGAAPLSGNAGKFYGKYLYPASNEQVLKKFFDLSGAGSYSYIKVKFKYYFIDSWNGPALDESNNDAGFAAFANSADGDDMQLGWIQTTYTFQTYIGRLQSDAMQAANKWEGNNTNTEHTQNVEMTAYKIPGSTGFWLMFGCSLNNVHSDESYGVGMIEIWVK